MIVNNYIQLFGLILQVGAGVFAVIKGWQAWLDNEVKKFELKVELAKHNSLTAVQVADILTHYQSVKKEVEDLKTNTKTKDAEFLHAIDKLEELLDELSQNFTQFLINKAK